MVPKARSEKGTKKAAKRIVPTTMPAFEALRDWGLVVPMDAKPADRSRPIRRKRRR